MVSPIPDDYPRVNASPAVAGAADAIDFDAGVFGVGQCVRVDAPGGKVGHAELEIHDSPIGVADEYPALDVGALRYEVPAGA